MELDDSNDTNSTAQPAPSPHPPDANGSSPSLSSVDSSLLYDDDGQPQQKRQRVVAGTAADDGRALRVQIPQTPTRSATAGHLAPVTGGRGGAVEGAMAQLSRLREWQTRAREEMELLQLALDTAAATAVLRHDKPLTEPFHVFEASLTAAVPLTSAQPVAPGTPARPPAAATGSFPVPPFYRSATEPFQSPYSSQASPMPPSTPSFSSPFPFPPSSAASNLPSPSSSLAHMTLEQLEARRTQLTALISNFQRSAGALLPLGTEPPRNKTHWDYLLQEALWMSGDFQREKRWKVKVAKQLSKAVLQHWQRVREKDAREKKAEVARRRKQCGAIAREVRKFWQQIGKLVQYKHTQAVEREKKEAMARHLEILVDQTESYSSQLAMDMRKGEEKKEVAPEVDETRVEEKQAVQQVEEEVVDEANLDDILKGLNGGASPSSQHSEERSERSGRRRKRRTLEATTADGEASAEEKDDGDVFEVDESSEDDEETLEEEEEQEEAEAEDVEDRHAKEVEELNEEAEMSVEELKRKYGIGVAENEEEEEEDEEGDGEGDGEEEDGEQEEQMDEGEAEEEVQDDEKMADDEDVIPESPPSASTSSSTTPTPATSSSALALSSHSAEEARLTAASSLASSAQPTGNTLATHKVHTRTPFLLRGSLREYQQVGLDWLASMYTNALNGILADEMGLGKTVMTIALLGWLACEKGIWGQHLIVVPTSVMINWEMEFKRFLPGLRILCYHGSAKERKEKRKRLDRPQPLPRVHHVVSDHTAGRAAVQA